MKEALHYEKSTDGKVQCFLCPHRCKISDGLSGICQIRENKSGILYAKTYAECSAIAIDPIEKKPLYHFFPGESILSLGTIGCNFKCPYCQNWHISQNVKSPTQHVEPEKAVELALEHKSTMISYTYSEPLIWFEYVFNTSKLCHEKNIKNVLVTNGYIEKKPLAQLLPFIDAMNIDVKAFTEEFYRKMCFAELAPVLKNVETVYDKTHVELTMLVIPTLNDNKEDIQKFVDWVSALSSDIPVHFSRYFPQYKLNLPVTPEKTLEMAYDIASEKLNYVYLGNASIAGANNTYCPKCENLLIERQGFSIQISGLKAKRCSKCNTKIAIEM